MGTALSLSGLSFFAAHGTGLAYIAITMPGMNIVRFDKFFQEVIES